MSSLIVEIISRVRRISGLRHQVLFSLPDLDDGVTPVINTRELKKESSVNKKSRTMSTPIKITGKLSRETIETERQTLEEEHFRSICDKCTWKMFDVVSRSRSVHW